MIKKELETISQFISITPPLIHSRVDYKSPCKFGCKACYYELIRSQALDAILKVKQLIEKKDLYE